MPTEHESRPPAAAPAPRRFCKGCGYSLFALESRLCPECGRAFDPANRRTFATRPPRGWVWRWGRRVMALLLLLTLTAGAGVGWLWWGWHAEQPTIARLRTLHRQFTVVPIGPVRMRRLLGDRWGYLTDRVDSAVLSSLGAAETEQLDLASLSQLRDLRLTDCEVSNSNLNRLAVLRKLQTFHLVFPRIRQPDLAFLDELTALSALSLKETLVSEAGFEHVGRLKHLKLLNLTGADTKDASVQCLQGLASLETLHLDGNDISDAGLEHLQHMKSLRYLTITWTRVSPSGVAKLKQAIPELQVVGP